MLCIFISLTIPVLRMPASATPGILPADDEMISWFVEPLDRQQVMLQPITQEVDSRSVQRILPWLYFLVAAFMIGRSVMYLIAISRKKRYAEYIPKGWYKLFKISHDRPFSFFSNVFMPKSLFGTKEFDQVLRHECEHVRLFHSVDRLILDFVVSLFWFNPFIYLYRNALIEIHEFQADEGVIRHFHDAIGYQEILFSQLQSFSYSGLVSHFNVEIIKKRIVMMNKQNKISGGVYTLTVPVMLMVVLAFSSKEAMQPIDRVGDEIADLLYPEDTRIWSEIPTGEKQQDYTPSILPLKKVDAVRMTSGFGMRTHPIDKQKRMHKGVDFSCSVGSEVLATADGTVEKVEPLKDGYGNLLTLRHGEHFVTRYAQLSAFKVQAGDQVKRGEVIALSGNSGASTAPHLHYEVIKDGEHQNPALFIKNYEIKTSKAAKPSKPKYEELRKQEEALVRAEMAQAEAEEKRINAEIELIQAREAQEQASIEKHMAELAKREAANEIEKQEMLETKEQELLRRTEIHQLKKLKEKEKKKSKDKQKGDL